MRGALATLFVALSVAGGNILLTPGDDDPGSTRATYVAQNKTYNIGGEHVLNIHRSVARVVPGSNPNLVSNNPSVVGTDRVDSLDSRNVQPREQTGGSYTGNGSARVIGYSREQCVVYFKRMAGITRSLGYAGNITPQGKEPKIGAGAIEYGHISYIVAYNDQTVTVHESNWLKGKITERTIPRSKIRGYLYE